MSEPESKAKIKLVPTAGIDDYASQYRAKLTSGDKIIESAKYFIQLRKSHLTEILDKWGEIEDDVDLETASVILNEFLSPTCTLLEFEYKNLTKAGQEEEAKPATAKTETKFNEIWQMHILGRVLTNQSHEVSITIPANAKSMFTETPISSTKTKSKIQEALIEDGEGTSCGDVEECAVEVFTLYKRVRWFIRNVKIDTLQASRFAKTDLKRGIDKFHRSFSTTWKAVTCLVYLDIIETMRSDANNTVGVVFSKCSTMMLEDKHGGVLSKESTDMLKVADLFINRYRSDWDEDEMFRCGLAYLSIKLATMKAKQDGDPNILSVCSLLSDEEIYVSEVYDLMKEFNDFSECDI